MALVRAVRAARALPVFEAVAEAAVTVAAPDAAKTLPVGVPVVWLELTLKTLAL